MKIVITGACVHNLKNIDVEFSDGLTAVTGLSGSGKTSLVFDTLYAEARRRLMSVFSYNFLTENCAPAQVKSISGLCPVTALKQNLVNRNPNSILATASGIHPFLRMLFSNFGIRSCHECGNELLILSRDEIAQKIIKLSASGDVRVFAPLVLNVAGSHSTLLAFLAKEFPADSIYVDGRIYDGSRLESRTGHDIFLRLPDITPETSLTDAGKILDDGTAFGISSFNIEYGNHAEIVACEPVCPVCSTSAEKIHPKYFHFPCPYCNRKGCDKCRGTGLHPASVNVKWNGKTIIELLALTAADAYSFFSETTFHFAAERLQKEICQRLEMLNRVGLGYISLDRPSPTLSRGESQRLRLAVALTSRLEDIVHILDEPTIGLHPADVVKLIPGLKGLGGPVIFIEHDNLAVCHADHVIDMGPGAGASGGNILYAGTPYGLWQQDSPSGRFFSSAEKTDVSAKRGAFTDFIRIEGAGSRNLKNIDVMVPCAGITVITGVSGSGKSTLVEDVLVSSLEKHSPVGCRAIHLPQAGHHFLLVYVDQNPIGINSRSNPATYTGLAGVIRDIFSALSGKNKSLFSFNTLAGACPECNGTGTIKVRMRYLPSAWITCSACDGKRFSDEAGALAVELAGKKVSVADVYEMSIDETISLFENAGNISPAKKRQALGILGSLHDTGLGYLRLGQPSPSLSGGEAQRIKLAKYLGKNSPGRYLLFLDEPTTGLHPSNVRDLLCVLNRLADAGLTIVIIEHNIDMIRSADWIIDLGPGSGPDGGRLIYQGNPAEFLQCKDSVTADMLNRSAEIKPVKPGKASGKNRQQYIVIENAGANNLKNVSVKIPKSKLTVVTGISGSGKSSLVHDILENEAKHAFFESLSVYERYNTREKTEIKADSVKGLGITMSINTKPKQRDVRQSIRSTAGTVSEIAYHMGVLFSFAGRRDCPSCGTGMERKNTWVCPSCRTACSIGEPHHFLGINYASACLHCHGVGTVSVPNPDKLVRNPEKPLCSGAMYSPGFFPQGYLCKPYNGGYYIVMAFAEKHGFDPFTLPWNKMKKEVRHAFLFGDTQLKVTNESRTGRKKTYDYLYRGFYNTWLRDWDMFGTYTDMAPCPECSGSKLRTEYNAVHIGGKNIHALNQMSLKKLKLFFNSIQNDMRGSSIIESSFDIINRRIDFLIKSGLGYVSPGRPASTLSAGEAQRVRLAALLGSDLNAITVLLDEPTRGLHPGETETLTACLKELVKNNNTVIVVEHDPLVIAGADHVIDMGPGSGADGGQVVYEGTPDGIKKAGTVTGKWMTGQHSVNREKHTSLNRPFPDQWFILRGASENNLKIDEVKIPYGMLVGICGVSGSGKSTLLIDTIGRILAPGKHTTSVSNEPLQPGAFREILNAPANTVIIDQVISSITSPSDYLGLTPLIEKYFASSEEREIAGIDLKLFRKCCSACRGRGWTKMNFSFLPDVVNECMVCGGTGYPPETGNVRISGYALPEIFRLTLDEAFSFFSENIVLQKKLGIALKTGLGYLVLRQPSYTLSGGEVQRLKIAGELCNTRPVHTFYILDEPTVGLHLDDVSRLVAVMQELVEAGNTVIIIEHHLHVLSACDYLVELGPGGGEDGGQIIYTGTPVDIVNAATPTSIYIKQLSGGVA